jgi:hypothetical protein
MQLLLFSLQRLAGLQALVSTEGRPVRRYHWSSLLKIGIFALFCNTASALATMSAQPVSLTLCIGFCSGLTHNAFGRFLWTRSRNLVQGIRRAAGGVWPISPRSIVRAFVHFSFADCQSVVVSELLDTNLLCFGLPVCCKLEALSNCLKVFEIA